MAANGCRGDRSNAAAAKYGDATGNEQRPPDIKPAEGEANLANCEAGGWAPDQVRIGNTRVGKLLTFAPY
eukprot:8280115-Alexandrium_andersonii.AAC.1